MLSPAVERSVPFASSGAIIDEDAGPAGGNSVRALRRSVDTSKRYQLLAAVASSGGGIVSQPSTYSQRQRRHSVLAWGKRARNTDIDISRSAESAIQMRTLVGSCEVQIADRFKSSDTAQAYYRNR
jgi:hypothetical protein